MCSSFDLADIMARLQRESQIQTHQTCRSENLSLFTSSHFLPLFYRTVSLKLEGFIFLFFFARGQGIGIHSISLWLHVLLGLSWIFSQYVILSFGGSLLLALTNASMCTYSNSDPVWMARDEGTQESKETSSGCWINSQVLIDTFSTVYSVFILATAFCMYIKFHAPYLSLSQVHKRLHLPSWGVLPWECIFPGSCALLLPQEST